MTHKVPTKAPSAVALIPARAGSKRLPKKNVRVLAGHPLLAYTIAAARASATFAQVVVSTDCPQTAAIARHYGAAVPFVRPARLAGDRAVDVDWVEDASAALAALGHNYDVFAILRPTSPFRQAETIQRAFARFLTCPRADSLRAVEKCSQHPGKMWLLRGGATAPMVPLLPFTTGGQPWHSQPTQALEEVYVQNASLEIAWTHVITRGRSIAGTVVVPFVTQGHEGLDVNQPEDWDHVLRLVASGLVHLPMIDQPAYAGRRKEEGGILV